MITDFYRSIPLSLFFFSAHYPYTSFSHPLQCILLLCVDVCVCVCVCVGKWVGVYICFYTVAKKNWLRV